MTLTGTPLLILMATAAVLGPLALVIWLRRRRSPAPWSATLARFGLIIICQLLAVLTLFLWVNQQYGFYTSWADLTGRKATDVAIRANGLVQKDDGKAVTITVPGGRDTNGGHQVLVWLPKQYSLRSARKEHFPVVMVLPGQPSTPKAQFEHFNFATVATEEIDSGRVKPFIAVFPPIMTNPPRDTECTNVPDGPQAETWLSRNVYNTIQHKFRVTKDPWSTMGWSTGAFCVAKLLLHYPEEYSAAVGMGGYYETLSDNTTGNLFHSEPKVKQQNSPLWLYQHGGMHTRHLLIVTGREDHESYASSARFLAASHGDPDVSSLTFPTGGHNYRDYRLLLPTMLHWLANVQAIP